jgi:hypothetical protein
MVEADAIPLLSKPRRRLLLWVAVFGCPAVLILTWLAYRWYLGREYRAAIAEADRLDPGWRLFELEAARAEVPDEENAALQILAAKKLMPAGWFQNVPKWDVKQLEDDINHLPPNERLGESERKLLATELAKAAAALAAARPVAVMPRGRYSISWTPDAIGTLLPHVQDAGDVRWLLWVDAVRRAEDGDIGGALVSCRAILNTGRSLGDETTAVSMIIRLFCQRLAVRSLERLLAQGLASEAALVQVQRLLEDESEQPLMLIAARAHRAMIHQFLEFVEDGGSYRAKFGLRSQTGSNEVDEFLDRGKARGGHAAYLRYLNQWVEIAKLPPEEQVKSLRDFNQQPPQNLPQFIDERRGDIKDMARSFHSTLAFLRCGIAAVAAERYRLSHNRWPDRLDDLVPAYLSKMPIDPFDGQPIRCRRLKDGVIVYTVGEDQDEDGSRRVRVKGGSPDIDVGLQLWNPEKRRQAQ